MVRGFAQQHPVWFGAVAALPSGAAGVAVGAIGASEGLSIWQWLLVGGVGASVGFLLGAVVLGAGLLVWTWPGRRRRRTVNRIQQRIRDLRIRDTLTPIVQRARYFAGEGQAPTPEVEPWRRNDAEAAEVTQTTLEPLRQTLIEEGQPHLAAQVEPPAPTVNATPSEFALELDHIVGLVDVWLAPDNAAVFKVGRFGGT